MVGVFVVFIRVVYGRMIYMSLPSRAFRQNPHHNERYFGTWIFWPKSARTQFLDISCPISRHFGHASLFEPKFRKFLASLFEPKFRKFLASIWRLVKTIIN